MLIMIQSRRPSAFPNPSRPPELIPAIKPTKLIKRYRVDDAEGFRLAAFDPADTSGLDLDKDNANAMLAQDIERLARLQERLYAYDRWALLVVLQGMDAAGKDGAIKHVTSGINPQGCEVYPFKPPTAEELNHHFLWRTAIRLPERGHIGIFNRSHYEEVLVVRVHPDMLARQKLPDKLVTKNIWKERFKDIRAFERHLPVMAWPSSSYSFTSPRKSNVDAFSPGSTNPPSAGSSPWATSPNASSGTNTWPPMRT